MRRTESGILILDDEADSTRGSVVAAMREVLEDLVRNHKVARKDLDIVDRPVVGMKMRYKKAISLTASPMLLIQGMPVKAFAKMLAMCYHGNIDPKYIMEYWAPDTQWQIQERLKKTIKPAKRANFADEISAKLGDNAVDFTKRS